MSEETLTNAEEQMDKEATPYDALTKNLSDHFGPELLVYLHQIEPLSSCESVGGEVEIAHRLSDRFWKVTQDLEGQEHTYLMHIEFESSYDPHIGRRLGAYGWGLFEKEALPVRSLVWWVGDKRPSYWPDAAWFRDCQLWMSPGDVEASRLSWREVWLPGGFEAQQFIEEAPTFLLPFVAKMEGGTDKQLLIQARDAILHDETLLEGQRQDLLVTLLLLASKNEAQAREIMEIFDMDTLEKNPLIKLLSEKIRQEGIQEGLEKGLEKGREEKVQKVQQIALLMLSEGESPQKVSRFTGLSLEQVQSLKTPNLDEPQAKESE